MKNMHVGLFLVAIALSAVSAYYSILGLAAIFSASWWSVVILASILEVGKLVLASWLYRNWRDINLLIRTYLTIAVITLMVITSVGTFGFLSQAHALQDAQAAQTQLTLNHIQSQTDIKQQELAQVSQTISQLDRSINIQLDANRAQSALNARRQQQTERAQLQARMNQIQADIQQLNNRKLELNQVQIGQETKLGPIRYVMAIVNPHADPAQAVKWLILVLVMVCDPLAVLMVMAASARKPAQDEVVIMPGTIRFWNTEWQAYNQGTWMTIPNPTQMPSDASPDSPCTPDLKPLAELVDQVVTEVIKQRPIFEVHDKNVNSAQSHHVIIKQMQDIVQNLPTSTGVNLQDVTNIVEETLNNWVSKNLTVTYTADHTEIKHIVNEAIAASVATLKDQMQTASVPLEHAVNNQEPHIPQAEPAIDPVPESEPAHNVVTVELVHDQAADAPTPEPAVPSDGVMPSRAIYEYQGEHRIRGGKKKES